MSLFYKYLFTIQINLVPKIFDSLFSNKKTQLREVRLYSE